MVDTIKCECREPPKAVTKTSFVCTRPVIKQILDPLNIFEPLFSFVTGSPQMDDAEYYMAYPGPSVNDHIWLKPLNGTLPLGDKLTHIEVPGYALRGVIPVSYDGEWYECLFDAYSVNE